MDQVLPKDATLLAVIMQSLGIEECEPQVLPLLLEYVYRHVTDTLQNATSFSEYAGRQPLNELSIHDVRFAIQARSSHAFNGPIPRDLLLEIATRKNSEPLPLLRDIGQRILRLPPEEHLLIGQQAILTAAAVPRPQRSKPSE